MNNANSSGSSGQNNPSQQVQYSDKKAGDLRVVGLFIILLIIWVLVDLWVIFFRNLARRTFGFDERNTVHSFAYAFAWTVVLIGFVILAVMGKKKKK